MVRKVPLADLPHIQILDELALLFAGVAKTSGFRPMAASRLTRSVNLGMPASARDDSIVLRAGIWT